MCYDCYQKGYQIIRVFGLVGMSVSSSAADEHAAAMRIKPLAVHPFLDQGRATREVDLSLWTWVSRTGGHHSTLSWRIFHRNEDDRTVVPADSFVVSKVARVSRDWGLE